MVEKDPRGIREFIFLKDGVIVVGVETEMKFHYLPK